MQDKREGTHLVRQWLLEHDGWVRLEDRMSWYSVTVYRSLWERIFGGRYLFVGWLPDSPNGYGEKNSALREFLKKFGTTIPRENRILPDVKIRYRTLVAATALCRADHKILEEITRLSRTEKEFTTFAHLTASRIERSEAEKAFERARPDVL